MGHPCGTHSRYVIGCCLIPLGICDLKNNSTRITYEIGCVWGMPSLSPLSCLGQCYVFFRVYISRDTTALIGVFLQVNCRLVRYTLPRILQEWLEQFCKLTADFRYTLPRILQERLEHFCNLTVDFRHTLPRILQH